MPICLCTGAKLLAAVGNGPNRTTTQRGFTMGVVQAAGLHIANHTGPTFARAYPGGATPPQIGNAVGYRGNKASGLRQHVARNYGAGVGRGSTYPPLGYAAWCTLFGLPERVAQGKATVADATAQAQATWQAAHAKRSAAAAQGAKQAKQAAQAAPAPVPDPSVQA